MEPRGTLAKARRRGVVREWSWWTLLARTLVHNPKHNPHGPKALQGMRSHTNPERKGPPRPCQDRPGHGAAEGGDGGPPPRHLPQVRWPRHAAPSDFRKIAIFAIFQKKGEIRGDMRNSK